MDAKQTEEHRQYLLESAGMDGTISPPKKRRTPQKKTSPKRKATSQAAEENTPADDEAAEAEKPRKKAKPSPKGKTTKELPQGDTAAEAADAETETPAASKPKPSQKRKPARKAPTANTAAEASEAPVEKPLDQLNPFLAAKVQRVHDFIATASEEQSLLAHDIANHSLIHVPRCDVLGALIRMRSDYEIGYPFDANLVDIQSSIVDHYTTSVKTANNQEWLVIDPNAVCELEDEIQAKIEGWGLKDVSLLEIELEMMEMQNQKADLPEVMSAPAAMQALLDATWAAINEREAQVTERKELAKETVGVCPVPPAIVV